MGGKRSRLTKQRLVPFEAVRHVAHPYDRPRALHRVPLCGLTVLALSRRPAKGPRRFTKPLPIGVYSTLKRRRTSAEVPGLGGLSLPRTDGSPPEGTPQPKPGRARPPF